MTKEKAGKIQISYCIIAVFSSMFLAFGMYNVHSVSGVTEGGILGMTLFFEKVFNFSPAITSALMNAACYIFGWKILGKNFVVYSLFSTLGFSCAYRVCEQFDPLWPELYEMPILAAVLGALFVGIGAGICVRIGGAPSGDDALAMGLSKLVKIKIQWVYVLSDLTVLGLSCIYIPLRRIIFSLLTVMLSTFVIGVVIKVKLPKIKRKEK